jgi:hypothetical protein
VNVIRELPPGGVRASLALPGVTGGTKKMAEKEIREDYYQEDTIMAQLGRAVFDQYLAWCNKYGESRDEKGFSGAIQATIESYVYAEE